MNMAQKTKSFARTKTIIPKESEISARQGAKKQFFHRQHWRFGRRTGSRIAN
jgi:hypothetical protein